jgi:hypothetical protein
MEKQQQEGEELAIPNENKLRISKQPVDPSIALMNPAGVEFIRITKDGVFVDGWGKMPETEDPDAAMALTSAMMKFYKQWAEAQEI